MILTSPGVVMKGPHRQKDLTNEFCEEFSEDVLAVFTENTDGEINRDVMGTYNRCSVR